MLNRINKLTGKTERDKFPSSRSADDHIVLLRWRAIRAETTVLKRVTLLETSPAAKEWHFLQPRTALFVPLIWFVLALPVSSCVLVRQWWGWIIYPEETIQMLRTFSGCQLRNFLAEMLPNHAHAGSRQHYPCTCTPGVCIGSPAINIYMLKIIRILIQDSIFMA